MLTICDTHALVFDAIDPQRLSKLAREAIQKAAENGELACADISLWEIAMLQSRVRLGSPLPLTELLESICTANRLHVLPVTPAIAITAQGQIFQHGDAADRLIASTALENNAPLITADKALQALPQLGTIW